MRGLLVTANQQPELAGVFSTFAADTPQIYLDIDRDKAQVLGVKIGDIFNALQSTLGGFYINDFNLFGRTWQVNIQADSALSRCDRGYLPGLCARQFAATWSRSARWRRRASSRARRRSSATTASARRSSTARPSRAISSGQSLAAMERISRRDPAGRLRLRVDGHGAAGERGASGQTGIVLGLAVLFAYLFLVALYESWNIPVSVLLVGQRRACSARSAPSRSQGSPSMSMRRSASWCSSRCPPRTAS